MTRQTIDVFISGGGIAGLAAAAAFGHAGFSVVLADPSPPVDAAEAEGSDLRSTAFLQPARDLFERTGLWDALAPHAMPLDVLRAVDTVGWPPEIRASRDFVASDISDRAFGWNLPNWQTRHVLTTRIAQMTKVELRMGVGFGRMLTREREAIVTLTDGTTLSARLVVAADGRDSPVRDAVDIGVTTTRYGQKALAFNVTHPHPHENVSTELYNAGGAFVLVPLPDLKGGPASAVVWMNDGRRSLDLLAMDEAGFSREATLRSCGVLGELTLASPRRLWPVVTQKANRLTAQRTAIVAEAAHVLPPIGAQGLNTSLHDVVALVDLAAAAPGDLGGTRMLAAYETARQRDIRTRATVIDAFNRICRSDEVPVQALRLAGLKAVHDIAPLRRAVMRAGLGSSQST
jgi:2-octaprenyl-6-methoxyphenol hydroxylase